MQTRLTPPPSPSEVFRQQSVQVANAPGTIVLTQAAVSAQPVQPQYIQPQPQVVQAPTAAAVQQHLHAVNPPQDLDALVTKQPNEDQKVYDYRRRWAELSREMIPSLTPIQSETIGFYAAQIALTGATYPSEVTQWVNYTKTEICKKYPGVC